MQSEHSFLTSELLLPVAGDLTALGLDGLLAVGAGACSLPGAESAVPFVGYTHTPLPIPTVRLALLLSCRTQTYTSSVTSKLVQLVQTDSSCLAGFLLFFPWILAGQNFRLSGSYFQVSSHLGLISQQFYRRSTALVIQNVLDSLFL